MKAVCGSCPHRCALGEGQVGLCRARANRGGEVVPASYGRISSLALDPIEKKPLRRFRPGAQVFSVGGFGCNMRCPFCQNHEISMTAAGADAPYFSPETLVERARGIPGNIGIAYTYSEPLVGWEYVRDCARLAHEKGLQNVLVTNGMAADPVIDEILPHIDAMNIDLKGFTKECYEWLGGDLDTVKHFIERAASACHVELTTLIVPGNNDAESEMEAEAKYIASINPELPLHITRYFPRYHAQGEPTPIKTILRLAQVAGKHLKYVYPGNL